MSKEKIEEGSTTSTAEVPTYNIFLEEEKEDNIHIKIKGDDDLKLQIDLSNKTIMAIKHGIHSIIGTILLIVFLIIAGRGCANITDKINNTISNKEISPLQYEKN